MSKVTIITSTNKRISYTYNSKSGRAVHLDGIQFLVCKFSGGWRVLAPHLASTYILANKPYVYDTRKEAVAHIEANKDALKLHIHSIKKECGELVTVNTKEKDMKKTEEAKPTPTINVVYLVPHGICSKFGHVLAWVGPDKDAFYKKVDVRAWDISIANVEAALQKKGYEIKARSLTTKDCNYKKKVADFRAYCHSNRMVVK